MPTYTVQDKETKKIVTFEWNNSSPPTDSDMENVFAQAKSFTTKENVDKQSIQPKQKQSYLQDLLGQVPQTGGGIVGGLLTSGLPLLKKRVPAIGIGAAGGEAGKQLYQQFTGSPNAPKTSEEAATRIAKAGGIEGLGEIFGVTAAKIGGKMLAPFAKKVTPEAKEAIQYLKTLGIKQGLLPAEATDSWVLDIAQNISEAGIGSGVMQTFKQGRQKALEQISDTMVDQFGKRIDSEEAGTIFVDIISGKKSAHQIASQGMYEAVEDAAKDVTISTDQLKSFATPLLETAKQIKGIGGKTSGDVFVKQISKLPDNLSYQEAKELRSRLIAIGEELKVTNKNSPALGKIKSFTSRIDLEMARALKAQKPDAYDLWRETNNFYKTGKQEFDNRFIKKIMKAADPSLGGKPESIVNAIFKPGNITQIKQAKVALGSENWKAMKSYYMDSLFKKSATGGVLKEGGTLSGEKLSENIFKMGNKELSETFSPAEVHSIAQFTNALKLTQKTPAKGMGSMFIQLKTPSAAMQVGQAIAGTAGYSMGFPGLATTILVAPVVLSKMITNPKMANLLTQGLKISPKSPEYMGIATRIMSMAMREQKDYEQSLKETK